MQQRRGWLLLAVMLLAGCAAGPNELVNVPRGADPVAGFWLGLWQGLISPISFLLSLFLPDVSVYEVHNNGGWYNFGFVLGAAITFKGASSAKPSAKETAD